MVTVAVGATREQVNNAIKGREGKERERKREVACETSPGDDS